MKTYGLPYGNKSLENQNSVLIMGVGNWKRSDLGLGIHIINELEKRNLPKNIYLLKGDYYEINFERYINGFKNFILIDAANDTFAPGTIFIHRPDFTLDFSSLSFSRISEHDRYSYFLKKRNSVFLFTITAMDIDSNSNQLSFPIKKVIPRVVDEVTNLAHKLTEL